MIATLSILTVLAWTLGPAVFHDRINDATLGLALAVMNAQDTARETLGLNR